MANRFLQRLLNVAVWKLSDLDLKLLDSFIGNFDNFFYDTFFSLKSFFRFFAAVVDYTYLQE